MSAIQVSGTQLAKNKEDAAAIMRAKQQAGRFPPLYLLIPSHKLHDIGILVARTRIPFDYSFANLRCVHSGSEKGRGCQEMSLRWQTSAQTRPLSHFGILIDYL
jgi:hypothetical protein